jgi:uncharacterized protein (TIGR03000 family)
MLPRWLTRVAVGALAFLAGPTLAQASGPRLGPTPAGVSGLALTPMVGAYGYGGRPGSIASGLGGFGFSPMAGSIGYGASFAGYGYIFIRGLGLVPAYAYQTERVAGLGRMSGRRRGPAPIEPTAAFVTLKVPLGAEVWIDGQKSYKTGWERAFHSQGLRPGVTYHYDVRVRWRQAGKSVEQLRRVDVQAGDRLTVDFTTPAP